MHKKTIKFNFKNKQGKNLAGIIDLPDAPPLFYGIFAPCFTCTKESHAAHKLCRALSSSKIAMLRFDMTGLGNSEGKFSETNFTTRIDDIISACDALKKEFKAPKFIIGHSISGTAAIVAAQKIPSIDLLATLGAPSDPRYVIQKFKDNKQIVIKGDIAEITIMGRKISLKKDFMDDMLSYNFESETAKLNKKLFIFHAPHDEIVHFNNAQTIYERAVCDKELIRLAEDGTHLLERYDKDANFMAQIIYRYFQLHGRLKI